MRILGATFAVLMGISGAAAPDLCLAAASNAAPASAPESSDTTGSLPPTTPPAGSRSAVPSGVAKPFVSLRDSYAAIPLAERIAIQSDLVWSGNFSGPVNGEFSEQLITAVRAFQKQNKTKLTGVLNPAERAALIALVRPMQEQVGWQFVRDPITGARLGLPMKLAPNASAGKAGSLWSSAQGQVRIETFRIAGPATLADVFAQQKIEPVERKIEHQALHADSFALAGMQGLKKFHVRAHVRDGEIRGITILYDQAMDVTMDTLLVPMTSSFQPFANSAPVIAQNGATPRRKVEYGTGIVVSAVGHIVTDLQVIDACHVVVIPGLGNAERLAEDRGSNLALLRVYGAEDLVPLALLGDAPKGSDLTLVGIADPQSQAGNASISTTNTRLISTASTSGTVITLNQTPALGFSGAIALDKSGRFYGMVELKSTVVAGTAPAAPRARVVPAETIRNFVEANYVAPSSGPAGLENAKASVVRVICVRK